MNEALRNQQRQQHGRSQPGHLQPRHTQPGHTQPGHLPPGHQHDEAAHFTAVAATWDDPDKMERARNSAVLLRDLVQLNGSRLIEIGGGTGQMALQLADHVGSVTVTDPADGMVAVAQANVRSAGVTNVTAAKVDLLTDPAPGAPFDGAYSQLAWHHAADVDGLLSKTRQILVPGGFLAVFELDSDPDGDFHAHRPDFAGQHGFDRHEFADRMRAAGFVDVSVHDGGSVEKELDGKGRTNFTMFVAIGYAR